MLLFTPEAIVHPSFQMSFAATLALIAAYQYGLPWHGAKNDTPLAARAALWGAREIAGIMLASFVAGLATEPYAAYHFHRIAPYGVLANLLAMPVVSALVMPMGILGVLALPFGFDAPFWQLMGQGIDWMICGGAVGGAPARRGRPYARLRHRAAAVGDGGTCCCSACCARPLRLSGALLAVIATVWAARTPLPDVIVAGDGRAAAIRGADGRLSVLASGRDTFTIKEWLMADGDGRLPTDKTLHDGVRCDAIGCIGHLADGRLASMVLNIEAFAEDCARAAVVVSAREAPGDCTARLIDRRTWRAHGATTLRWNGNRFEETYAQPPGYDRPWARAMPVAAELASSTRPAARDATPRVEDLEPGDQAQYRRNNPTSLPWMRTRLGGRMRTS